MPRKTAIERHHDSAPSDDAGWPPGGAGALDVLVAFHHPTRRTLYELLAADGPAPVGRIARRAGCAVGSVSHHLKVLHRNGLVEPAPELAGDTRESWWRAVPRIIEWSTSVWVAGTAGRKIADAAARASFDHQTASVLAWLRTRDRLPAQWREVGGSVDTYAQATPEQVGELERRLLAATLSWSEEVRADASARPDVERRPVRAVVRVFPTAPGGAA